MKSIKEKAEAYDKVLEWATEAHKVCDGMLKEDLEHLFPELKESEDERIRKELCKAIRTYVPTEEGREYITWLEKQCETFTKKDVDDAYLKGVCDTKQELEKQSKQKTIMNTPPREVILSIWDLGNEWKELTNGSISTEYGTQLDYIQKYWHESEYYLKEKKGEQKPADKVEPIVVRDFNSVFSKEQVEEIDKRIEESQRLYNAKLRDAMRKVEDFPMTD